MKRSNHLTLPVISLLSPSRAASEKAQNVLLSLFSLEPQPLDSTTNDELDQLFHSNLPGFSHRWESVASKCPSTGTMLHMCSLESKSTRTMYGPFSLLAITDAPTSITTTSAVRHFRNLLAERTQTISTGIKIRRAVGLPCTSLQLLASNSNGDLPLLELPALPVDQLDDSMDNLIATGLKEIAIPSNGRAVYDDGSTLLSKLADSHLSAPATGLYKWTGSSTCIRPLPTASEDQRLSSPSLIFHSSCLEDVKEKAEARGGKTAKIGYGGRGSGQLLVGHNDFVGLDLRFCSRVNVSSAFAEAQESLLAGSPEDLQSTNILLAAGEQGEDDKRVGRADCWVEVRSNLKRPLGFWKRAPAGREANHKIAKAPDLPYE